MKKCSKCKEEKSLDCFGKDKYAKDGKVFRCKECIKQYCEDNKEIKAKYDKQRNEENKENNKQYYEDNKEKILKRVKEYAKNNKEKIAEYGKQYSKQYYEDNRDKILECCKQWRENNKDKRREQGRKRRALKAEINENFTSDQEQFVKERFNKQCWNCSSTDNIHIDHHRPLSKGNALTTYNAVLLCLSCNSSKGPKDPEDFYGKEKCEELDKILIVNHTAYQINKLFKGEQNED